MSASTKISFEKPKVPEDDWEGLTRLRYALALHRLGELAWCFDAAMLSEFPGRPWRDRQGRFVGEI